MRKTIYLLAAAILAFASCQEWEPVFTLSYGDVDAAAPQSLQVTATIAQLKDLYEKHGALKIEDDNMVIAGKVISDDHSGNIYRELYIKDDTGVISVKIGLSSSRSASTTACRSWAWKTPPASMKQPIWTAAT